MDSTDFDLLVIGGGPGGSTAAAFARKEGLSVCLVEREAFPRFHIGESLLPMGNQVLKESGAWPKVEAGQFVRKLGAEFMLADGSSPKEIVFAEGKIPGLEETFQVERARFDSILLEHARSLGAEIRIGSTVRRVEPSRDHVTTTVVALSGAASEVRSRFVVDAGGRENLYESARKRVFEPALFPKRAAVYGHFKGVKRAPGPRGGNILIVRLEDGWFWVIPVGSELTSVGLVTSIGAFRQGGDPGAVFGATVAGSPRLRELMAQASAVMPFRMTADYSYVRTEFASPRVLLAGDAATFFDPIFSSGVYLSTHSARAAISAIVCAHVERRALRGREQARYTREIKHHCKAFQKLIEVFYDNDSFAVFMVKKPPFDLQCGLTSIVAGHVRLTWPLWWRLKVFLAVCWLQKRFAIVDRITHAARVATPTA